MVKQFKRRYGQPVGKINKFPRLSRIEGKIAIEMEICVEIGVGKINSLRVCSSLMIKIGLVYLPGAKQIYFVFGGPSIDDKRVEYKYG